MDTEEQHHKYIMYLFLNSKDTNYPSNTSWDFTIHLSYRAYSTEGVWECALTELWVKAPNKLNEELFVYVDFITDASLVNGQNRNLIRIVRTNGELANPYYMPVRSTYGTQSVRVYIRSKNGSRPSLECEEVSCVLHLRRREE